jgi:E3 ubiquitin-protein ligase DOA10
MDGTEICRVCRGEGTPDHPLFYPCKCSGSMKYVHQDCLEEWLEHSHKKYCEICNYQFSFSPIYDASAPEKLSPLVLLKAMFKKTFNIDNVYFRIVFAMTFWLVWVPYATHWIWVFFEDPSVFINTGKTEFIIRYLYLLIHYKEHEEVFKETSRLLLQRFSRDVFHGQVISVIAILVGLVVLCVKEYADFRRNRIVVNNDQPFQQVIQIEEQLLREQQILDRQRQQIEEQHQQQRRFQEQQIRQQIHDIEMFLNNLEANRLNNENRN